jgi:hypothetical protein
LRLLFGVKNRVEHNVWREPLNLCPGVIQTVAVAANATHPIREIRTGLTPVEHGDLDPLFDLQGNDVAAYEAGGSDGEHLHVSPDGGVLTQSCSLKSRERPREQGP